MPKKLIQKAKAEKPSWLKMDEEELKKIIADLAKKYQQPAEIGFVLRDQYGIPTTKLYGKKLSKYLKEVGFNVADVDLKNAEKKLERMKEHLKNNITDRRTKHKLQKAQSRVAGVKRYLAKKH